MKHKLLSLFALAGAMLASASVWAQEEPTPSKWADPVKPVYPQYEGTWVDPEVNGIYYIYNVGAAQFLGTGQDWGTRSITTITQIVKTTDATFGVSANKNALIPYKVLQVNGTTEQEGTWYFLQRQNCSGGQGPYLCHEGTDAWADGTDGRRDSDQNGWWRFEQQEDGSYIIRPLDIVELDEGTGLTTNAFGLNAEEVGSTFSFTFANRPVDETSFVNWRFVSADDADAIKAHLENANEAYSAALAIYNAKVTLHTTLDEADAAGISEADINAAVAIYESETASEHARTRPSEDPAGEPRLRSPHSQRRTASRMGHHHHRSELRSAEPYG